MLRSVLLSFSSRQRSGLVRCITVNSIRRSGITEMMRKEDVASMRIDYKMPVFDESSFVAKEPFMQFDAWFKEAKTVEGIGEVNAMVLTTCGRDCRPRARIVLLKGYDKTGFTFYTNYSSMKGQQLNENPYACLLFYWHPLHRQVRIEGRVEKLPEKESENYFHSRPRPSQIGALVSCNQSSPIANREPSSSSLRKLPSDLRSRGFEPTNLPVFQVLNDKEKKLQDEYGDEEKLIPKPDYWGGFKVVPDQVEFWQGQSNRLHDRFVFRRLGEDEVIDDSLTKKGADGWVYERLSP